MCPKWSPTTWNSMCRAPSMYFSISSVSSPKLDIASALAWGTSCSSSAWEGGGEGGWREWRGGGGGGSYIYGHYYYHLVGEAINTTEWQSALRRILQQLALIWTVWRFGRWCCQCP
jgi:hypothetical protein